MKLYEIADEPLVVQILRQRKEAGDALFMFDPEYMHYDERILDFWRPHVDAYAFQVTRGADVRELVYSIEDLEKAEIQRRAKTTWSLVIGAEE